MANSVRSCCKYLVQLSSNGVSRCQCSPSRRCLHLTFSRLKAEIINGRAIAEEINREVKRDIENILVKGGNAPSLSVVLVGNEPASRIYVNNKMKVSIFTGIKSETVNLPASVSESDVLRAVEELNVKEDVDAILVQLPLPAHIRERTVCDAVSQQKDVDGFHVVNMGRLLCDKDSIVPCTPAGVLEMLRRSGIRTFGKSVVVVGRSKHICLPLAILLQADSSKLSVGGDATVAICHRHTPMGELKRFSRSADIIISGTGVPRLITADMVREGATVIDVGFTRIRNEQTGKIQLVGDVDFQGVVEKAGYITPVPGGVGPVTISMLMKNTLRLAMDRGDSVQHVYDIINRAENTK